MIVRCPLDHSFRLSGISRNDNRHIRQRTHECNVFEHLVGRTIFTDRQAGMSDRHFDIQFRVADGVSDLFIRSARTENSKCRSEWDLASRSKTRCHAHHIPFSNASIEETIRICFGKNLRLGGCREVSIQNYDIRIYSTEFFQCFTVCVTSCLTHHSASTALINLSHSSLLGALPCQPTWFSISGTPLPLTVFMTIMVGLPEMVFASSMAS